LGHGHSARSHRRRSAKPIIEQIAQAVRTALAEPAYQQKLIVSGFEASPDTTPEKFRRRLEADVAFWTPVVEALGLGSTDQGAPIMQSQGNLVKLPRRQFLHLAAGAAALSAVARVAWAQAYPARPVRIIVGFAPSGTSRHRRTLDGPVGTFFSEKLWGIVILAQCAIL
jgi:hypothetical protein